MKRKFNCLLEKNFFSSFLFSFLLLLSKVKRSNFRDCVCYLILIFIKQNEWGWAARNLIAQQSIGWHFWQEINCKTQNLSTAEIHLILAQLDSKSLQKSDKWTTLSSSWHFFLVQHINWKSQFLPIEMVNNFICRTCSWPKLPYLT